MSLQIIKSIDGKVEYVLLPISVYKALRYEINAQLREMDVDMDYVPFEATDYIDNPIALARIEACMTQEELAKRMNVSQAYISKIERQTNVSAKLLHKVNVSLKTKK